MLNSEYASMSSGIVAFLEAACLAVCATGRVRVRAIWYKIGCAMALVAFAIFVGSGHSEADLGEVVSRWPAMIAILVGILLPFAPFLLLVDAGAAGYLGFGSPFRYVALGLGILGFIGLSLISSLRAIQMLPMLFRWD